jgi:hypothetical protein
LVDATNLAMYEQLFASTRVDSELGYQYIINYYDNKLIVKSQYIYIYNNKDDTVALNYKKYYNKTGPQNNNNI